MNWNQYEFSTDMRRSDAIFPSNHMKNRDKTRIIYRSFINYLPIVFELHEHTEMKRKYLQFFSVGNFKEFCVNVNGMFHDRYYFVQLN